MLNSKHEYLINVRSGIWNREQWNFGDLSKTQMSSILTTAVRMRVVGIENSWWLGFLWFEQLGCLVLNPDVWHLARVVCSAASPPQRCIVKGWHSSHPRGEVPSLFCLNPCILAIGHRTHCRWPMELFSTPPFSPVSLWLYLMTESIGISTNRPQQCWWQVLEQLFTHPFYRSLQKG